MGRNGNIRRGDVFWVNAKEIEIFSPWAPEGSQFRDKDGHPSNSCALIDLMLVIDTPDFSTIPAEYGKDIIVVGHDEETGEDITEEIITAKVTVPIQIRVRNITELSNIIGFWGGDLEGDGKTSGESAMGNIFW